MLYISRKEHFNAAHKLYNPSWSKEKNVEVFGPCANDNGMIIMQYLTDGDG